MPQLSSTETEIARAYNFLASRRTCGMGPNPIQLSEIKAFVDLFGLPSIHLYEFVHLIGLIDQKYLELSNGNRGTDGRGDKPPSKR